MKNKNKRRKKAAAKELFKKSKQHYFAKIKKMGKAQIFINYCVYILEYCIYTVEYYRAIE